MAQPTTREELRKYGLRQNGEPVVQVNIAKSQQEDLLDDTIQFFHENHGEGLIRFFHPVQVTQLDIDNGYVDLPSYILGVTRMFPLSSLNANNIFTQGFNLSFSDFFRSTFKITNPNGFDIANWSMANQYLAMVEDLISGERQYEFSAIQQKLYPLVPMDDLFKAGDFIMLDTYRTVDPIDYPKVWNNIFVKRYYSALVKRQWGENLKKFGGMQLPGGVELNGKEIYEEAVDELEKIEEDVYTKYSEPPHFFTG